MTVKENREGLVAVAGVGGWLRPAPRCGFAAVARPWCRFPRRRAIVECAAAARLFSVIVAAFDVTVAGQRGLNGHAEMPFSVRTVRFDGPECRTLWLGWLL